MTDVPELRASDADRERTALALREHAAQGRLTLEEFAERLDLVYRARTVVELEELGRDLPAAAPALSRRRAKRFTGVIFGSVERKGRWRVGRRNLAAVALGNIDLDLRHAELDGPAASITAFILFGNVDVYVPQAIEVEVGGFTFFGHRREWGTEPPAHAGAPLLHVRVFALFGTADVWRVPKEMGTLGFRQVIKALRRGGSAELSPPS